MMLSVFKKVLPVILAGCITLPAYAENDSSEIICKINDFRTSSESTEVLRVVNNIARDDTEKDHRDVKDAIYAEKEEEVKSAPKTYNAEYKNAVLRYTSNSIYVVVRQVMSDRGTPFTLTHIVIADGSQIRGELAHDEYGGQRERPTDIAERTGSVVTINGSFFSYADNKPTASDLFIKDAKVVDVTSSGKTVGNGNELCLKKDGTLFSPPAGLTPGELLNMGVVDTFASPHHLLIDKGQKMDLEIDEDKRCYPRCIIGMVKPCEYYILNATGAGYSNGLTLRECQDILYKVGCTYAKALDEGNSAALVINGKLINDLSSSHEGERPVADFISFYEL